RFFKDGWGMQDMGVQADTIAVGPTVNSSAKVQIFSINYDTNTITLKNPINRNDGDKVWLYKDSSDRIVLYGSAPDIGAYEYNPSGTTTTTISSSTTTIPATTTTISPTTHSLSGNIKDLSNKAMDGLTVAIGQELSVTTNENGDYVKDALPDGIYTVKPGMSSKTELDYGFKPTSQDVTISDTDMPGVDFIGPLWIQAESKNPTGTLDPAENIIQIIIDEDKDENAGCDKYIKKVPGSAGEISYYFNLEEGDYVIWGRVKAPNINSNS
ncbi:unnamed protein product, partial [marine sediment metagenome]